MDLPQHVLRFWETRFPQIRPLKRAGGRRYYRPEDIERLRLIRRLLYDEGYTIKGVQKLFKEQGVQALSIAGEPAPAADVAKGDRLGAAASRLPTTTSPRCALRSRKSLTLNESWPRCARRACEAESRCRRIASRGRAHYKGGVGV